MVVEAIHSHQLRTVREAAQVDVVRSVHFPVEMSAPASVSNVRHLGPLL